MVSIWVYLAVMGAVLGVGYYVFRVKVRKDYEEMGKLSGWASVLETVIFFLHGMGSYTFLDAEFPAMPPLPESKSQVWLGFGLLGLGVLLTLWAMSRLGFKKAVGQDVEGLNRSGFYQYVRNPQIVFYNIVLIGYISLYPSWRALGWWAVFGVIGHWMVITEEEHLGRVFGEAYEVYCQEVGRYWPRKGKGLR